MRLLKRKRIQAAIVATEDLRLVPAELGVEKGYVVDHKTSEAWGLTARNQLKQRYYSRSIMLLFEREAAPPSFDGFDKDKRKDFAKLVDAIAEERLNDDLYGLTKDLMRDKMASAIQFIFITLAVLFGIVVLLGIKGNIF